MIAGRIGSGLNGERRRQEARRWHRRRVSQPQLPPARAKNWKEWVDDRDNLAEYRSFARLQSIVRALPPPSLPGNADLRAWYSRSLVYVAAGCAAAAAIAFVLVGPRIPWPSKTAIMQSREYTTEPGGPHEITLQDHSVVTLSGSTRLTVFFSEHRRSLVLSQGEAFFKVQHDPQAPFQVDVGAVRITDLGTTFDVRRYADEVVVSVAEGTVAVSSQAPVAPYDASGGAQSGSGAQLPWIEVKTGEAVTYDAKGEVSPAQPTDLEAFTAWLYGHRIYRGRPLARVIEDVQLYLPRRIDLDPALAAVRFSGYIDQHKAEQWVRGLPNIYPVEIDDSNPRRLLIRCLSRGCPEVPP
jgi:transmembrane sensor